MSGKVDEVRKRHRRGVKLLSASLIATSVLGVGSVSTVHAADRRGAEKIFYQTTPSFMAAKAKKGNGYDWDDNGCSVPNAVVIVSATAFFAKMYFSNECKQHDFGYRNFGGNLRLDPTEARRKSVDDHFLAQMMTRCNSLVVGLKQGCQLHAKAFYEAVRKFGRLFF